MRNSNGEVIYVGKAKNLKNRVSSYFKGFDSHSPKTKVLVMNIDDFEYIITDTEEEALILENNLIKEYKPMYNIRLKDDKTYPYIKITNEKFPRVIKVREVKKDGGRYFGPYTSDYDVNMTIDAIRDNFKIRRTNRDLSRDYSRPCLNYYIQKCHAPCMGYIDEAQYHQIVEEIHLFLNGKQTQLLDSLQEKMLKASENLQFEKAINYREQIKSLKNLSIKQKITTDESVEQDVICVYTKNSNACIMVFFIRRGMLIGREIFTFEMVEDTTEELISQFLPQFYSQSHIPKEIIFSHEPENEELYLSWLSHRANHKVKFIHPKKGHKHELVNMLYKNVIDYMEKYFEKSIGKKHSRRKLLEELALMIGHGGEIFRIEAYDISNISGVNNVAAMAVYEDGQKKSSDYRKFSIKSVEGADDYASMVEVIHRRFERFLSDDKNRFDISFKKKPDLLIIDGGKGHVECVLEELARMGIDIFTIGLAKDDYHRTHEIYCYGEFIPLKRHSEIYRFLSGIQEEVHRFAISYHRDVRNESMFKSELDDIPQVGKVRKKKLLQYFKSIEAIKRASVEEIMEAGFSESIATGIFEYWRSHGS